MRSQKIWFREGVLKDIGLTWRSMEMLIAVGDSGENFHVT